MQIKQIGNRRQRFRSTKCRHSHDYLQHVGEKRRLAWRSKGRKHQTPGLLITGLATARLKLVGTTPSAQLTSITLSTYGAKVGTSPRDQSLGPVPLTVSIFGRSSRQTFCTTGTSESKGGGEDDARTHPCTVAPDGLMVFSMIVQPTNPNSKTIKGSRNPCVLN